VTAGVYWTVWRLPTKCHIQTLVINTSSHGREMYQC
jgi:hypothetical protein